MTSPNDKITRNGQTLTRRVWDLIAAVGKENGVTLQVGQGGFKAGSGASASAGTHDRGDVFDIRINGMSRSKCLAVVNDFREWYGDAWLRSPEFGWPASAGGSHIHVVMADSHYALSRGAQQQVTAYNNGRNGLASNARDPHPRPARQHFPADAHPPVPPADTRPAVRLANLRYGQRNDDVKDLQRALNRHNVSADLPVTGFYGDLTDAAVRADQRRHGFGNDAPKQSHVGRSQAAHLGLRVV
jgi:hypothetical protein